MNDLQLAVVYASKKYLHADTRSVWGSGFAEIV
jgi:hypothetical protein